MKAVLKELHATHRQEGGDRLRAHIASWLDEVMPKESLSVGLFSSLADEISTHDVDLYLSSRGAKRAVVCADNRHELCFYALSADEPACSVNWKLSDDHENSVTGQHLALDVIFVPGLAFDQAGNRLGRGKGCFDRGLKKLAIHGTRPVLVGLLFDEQLVEHIPCADHDVAVDYICTPETGLLKAPIRDSHA